MFLAACGGGGLETGADAPAGPARYLTGAEADVAPPLFGPAWDLGGGGPDVDAAIQWLLDAVRGCTGCERRLDVVVLRASGADGYNAPIAAMNGVDSVETIVLGSRADAERPEIAAAVGSAEVVFFAGGDQCDYVQRLAGTPVGEAVVSVVRRGGGVGGTSAGAMILGGVAYDACSGSVTSAEALGDPFHPAITFSPGLSFGGHLEAAIVDTHLTERGRLGRLLAFLARQVQEGRPRPLLGVGIDEATSLVVEASGLARALGRGQVLVLVGERPPEFCVARHPLTYLGVGIARLESGETIDLAHPEAAIELRIDAREGALQPARP